MHISVLRLAPIVTREKHWSQTPECPKKPMDVRSPGYPTGRKGGNTGQSRKPSTHYQSAVLNRSPHTSHSNHRSSLNCPLANCGTWSSNCPLQTYPRLRLTRAIIHL